MDAYDFGRILGHALVGVALGLALRWIVQAIAIVGAGKDEKWGGDRMTWVLVGAILSAILAAMR